MAACSNCGAPARTDYAYSATVCEKWPNCCGVEWTTHSFLGGLTHKCGVEGEHTHHFCKECGTNFEEGEGND